MCCNRTTRGIIPGNDRRFGTKTSHQEAPQLTLEMSGMFGSVGRFARRASFYTSTLYTHTYRQLHHDTEDKGSAVARPAASCAGTENAIGRMILGSFIRACAISLVSPFPHSPTTKSTGIYLSTSASISLPGSPRAAAGEAPRHCSQRNKSATTSYLLCLVPLLLLHSDAPGARPLSLPPLLQPCPHIALLVLLKHLPTTYRPPFL